ncbi:DUF4430 domain-containing protein [Streptomyces boncukensis]|uniref:DUF4430 domain-containing protein n=1 Tax=Streptomyces boncukensis TaxID=2711219 RepID=A0A6G4X4G8_9ACTN|nr:DUF4430 domain-containing protein [Streptomyces boncukensis]NGO72415.1 DUF4430 domain-containing protein [Streptomyces boncukensis]
MRNALTTRRAALVTAAAAAALTLTAAPAATAATAAPAPQANDPVTVALSVQGPDGSIYDDTLSTTGHDVTTPSGGTHPCDGTNNGANDTPGATPTAALDDAAKNEGFTWDGPWYPSFEDYLVTTIDGKSGGQDAFWSISVNGTPTEVGGCQLHLKEGDKVAFTWTEL